MLCLRRIPRLKACPRLLSSSSMRDHELEVEKFEELSSEWWRDDKDPLLLMNQLRVPLVRSLVGGGGGTVLDVGCGGGYLAESLAREGDLSVTGVDPSKEMIRIARAHAALSPTGKYVP
eukprot:sb/3476334/